MEGRKVERGLYRAFTFPVFSSPNSHPPQPRFDESFWHWAFVELLSSSRSPLKMPDPITNAICCEGQRLVLCHLTTAAH